MGQHRFGRDSIEGHQPDTDAVPRPIHSSEMAGLLDQFVWW
jgi:hypothetical protein